MWIHQILLIPFFVYILRVGRIHCDSIQPTVNPSLYPTNNPSINPTHFPTSLPTERSNGNNNNNNDNDNGQIIVVIVCIIILIPLGCYFIAHFCGCTCTWNRDQCHSLREIKERWEW